MAPGEFALTFEAFGVTAELATDDDALRDRLPEALPPGARARETSASESAGARFWLVAHRPAHGEAEVSVERVGLRSALIDVSGLIERHLAEHAPDHVFVHAGVVAYRHVGIVIPGHTLSGKTTLVAELVRAGATYYSDEFAVVDGAGAIHPYPRPLSLRHDPRSGDPEPARWHDLPGRIRGQVPVMVPEERVGRAPIRAGLIVVTRHRPGADWRPTEADRGAGALALMKHSVVARTRLDEALRAVSRMSEGASILVGSRGEARETAHAVLARAGRISASYTPA